MTMSPDLNDYADTQARRGSARLEDAAARLKDSAGMVQARVGDFAEDARAYAERARGQLSTLSRSALDRAKERPATSAVVVLGIGIAVGAILALALRGPATSLADSALDGATRLRRKLNA
ncbi:MAG: hypothetical protein JWO33_980 [Caulobacteraceae bacterium]|nr:hypothetical protein [Caulobacteraceae bacterium]